MLFASFGRGIGTVDRRPSRGEKNRCQVIFHVENQSLCEWNADSHAYKEWSCKLGFFPLPKKRHHKTNNGMILILHFILISTDGTGRNHFKCYLFLKHC